MGELDITKSLNRLIEGEATVTEQKILWILFRALLQQNGENYESDVMSLWKKIEKN